MVGKTGFEPATPWSQTKCATICATSLSLRPDSNQRPTDYKSVALPTELRRLIGEVINEMLSGKHTPHSLSFPESQPPKWIYLHPWSAVWLRGGSVLGSHQLGFRLHLRVLTPPRSARLSAEDERFELPDLLQSIVFKTTAIDHSANLPLLNII